MAVTTSPLAARRKLGEELRALRLGAQMTTEDVGQHLRRHNSHVSRVETGKRAIARQDFVALMKLYTIEGDRLRELTALMLKSTQRAQPWWHVHFDVISASYSEFLAYEAEATRCCEYQPLFLPALVQTPEYARAVTGVGFTSLGPDQVDSLVEVRMRRQDRLHDEEPFLVECVITEAALQFHVGGPDVLRGQLRHLQQVAKLPSVSLKVIPYTAGEMGLLTGGFTLFGTGENLDADVCFTESAVSTAFRDDALTLRKVNRLFRNLSERALSAEDSLALIAIKEKELK